LQNLLPADLVDTITEDDDPEQLDRWFDLSQTANTLAEFRANAGI
jgi:hypothetical protein